ncbi:TraB/GumN family protein [Vibrio salinus]|uniref:TraB/GumN family protein n=1 Tax=Vibrio salinus TaxID=2899784 RepID=UPI00356A770F
MKRFQQKKSGKYLVAVGLLHLIGNDNLIELLKEQGFAVVQKGRQEKSGCRFLN